MNPTFDQKSHDSKMCETMLVVHVSDTCSALLGSFRLTSVCVLPFHIFYDSL